MPTGQGARIASVWGWSVAPKRYVDEGAAAALIWKDWWRTDMPRILGTPITTSSTITTATVSLALSTTLLLDVSASAEFGLEVSKDQGATWKPYVQARWRGGAKLDTNGLPFVPSVTVRYDGALQSVQVRGFLVPNKNFPLDASVVVT